MIIVKEISTVPPVTSGPVGTFAPEVRIIAVPEGMTDSNGRAFFVNLPVCSSKLARRAYGALPESVEHDGCTYCKCGMRAADCIAWYIKHG